MKNTATKALRALCGMVVMLALMAGITSVSVLATSNGIYTATATSHYRHPTTGVIEDSGGEGSAVLGQSMTDSALNKSALVEVDANGNTSETIIAPGWVFTGVWPRSIAEVSFDNTDEGSAQTVDVTFGFINVRQGDDA